MYTIPLASRFSGAMTTINAAPDTDVPSDFAFTISSLSYSHENMLTSQDQVLMDSASDVDFAMDLGFDASLSVDLGPDLDLDLGSSLDLNADMDLNIDGDAELDPETAASIILNNITPEMRNVLDDCIAEYQKRLMSPEE